MDIFLSWEVRWYCKYSVKMLLRCLTGQIIYTSRLSTKANILTASLLPRPYNHHWRQDSRLRETFPNVVDLERHQP